MVKAIHAQYDEGNRPIINPTIRGGHLIFKARIIDKSSQKAILKFGIKADYLTNSASILGPRKSIFDIPENQNEIPLLPPLLEKHPYPQTLPIIDGKPILEGFRNSTIFKWVNSKLNCNLTTRKALAFILGNYFCKPPLDAKECNSMVREDTIVSDNEKEENKQKPSVREVVENDIKLVHEQLKNKFAFDRKVSRFYKFSGTHWIILFEDEMIGAIEDVILDKFDEFQSPIHHHSTRTISKTHLARSMRYLSVPNEWREFPHGINWQNGYLDVETGDLLDHTYARWVTSIRKSNYNKDELLSYDNQKLIVQSCGGNIHTINALLTCGNRVISPKPGLETSYYFSGPAGSGKSLFTSLFRELSGSQAVACEISDIERPFMRAELVDKNLLIFNEFIKVNAQSEKYLKSFIGRDAQSSEVKYVQGHNSEVFEGIMIIVSNLGPDLTYGMSSAMNDRFIPVDFVARMGSINPNLSKQLSDNESGLVNLLIKMDPEIFKDLTRAGLINKELTYDSNILVPFILSKLFFEVGSVIPITALNEGFREWELLRNDKKEKLCFDLTIDLASVSLLVFNRRLFKDRRSCFGRRCQVLVGLRWKEKTDLSQERNQNSFIMTNDPWLPLRGKSNAPIYEITDYQSDLEKENKQVNSKGVLVTKAQKSTTTVEVQKQYFNTETNPINPVIKKKSAPRKQKASLIFAESISPQFIIPEKLSDEVLGVTKLTNKDEQDKYLDQPLPDHPKEYFLNSFGKCSELLKVTIASPLGELVFKEKFKYHPHVAYKETEIIRERVAILSKLGTISSEIEKLFGGSEIIWCESLRAAQLKFPVPVGKSPAQQNLFQTKKNFTGHLFPTYYYFDSSGSPRLKSYPGHTIRDGHKGFRSEVFKRFSQYCGMYLYDTDLSSCHVRVIMMFLTKEQAPLLYKSFSDKDLYLEIALDLKKRCADLNVFSDKALRKIIKIKCLAMLNGGGTRTESHIDRLVDILYDKDSADYKAIMKIIIPQLADLPIVNEFRAHGEFISSQEKVFLLTNSSAVTSSDSKHILSSPVMCAVESLAMTFLMEYISKHYDYILPLTTIHDGMALLSNKKMDSDNLDSFNLGFTDFVKERLGIPLPIETEDVGFDFET